MNNVALIGRLTRDPQIRYSQGDKATCIARFTLAVDRRFKREGDDQTADFPSCVAFGKTGEFIEKYGKKGIKFAVIGRLQTGSYTNKDGQTVYTTDVVVESVEFAESKSVSQANTGAAPAPADNPADDGFMNVPDEIDEELPFN